jgi:predicted nuclease of predicted toxin-antitoxin system
MDWALANDHIVFTHDLDFTTTLALTHASGPSVFQVRTQNVLPDYLLPTVMAVLRQHENDLLADRLWFSMKTNHAFEFYQSE